jgi:hypothetical protein
VITIGIDPHKTSVTAAALDPASEILGHRRLAYTAKTARQLLAWADRWPDRTWAVEGAAGLGHGVAQQLVAAGERVVPAGKLSPRYIGRCVFGRVRGFSALRGGSRTSRGGVMLTFCDV